MRVHEYLRILVIDSKIVDYEYFMNYINDWEIIMLLRLSSESHRTAWETARYISYNNAILSGNLKKQYAEKTMMELFPLPYDERYREAEKHDYEISSKQINALKARSQRVGDKLFKK